MAGSSSGGTDLSGHMLGSWALSAPQMWHGLICDGGSKVHQTRYQQLRIPRLRIHEAERALNHYQWQRRSTYPRPRSPSVPRDTA